MSKLTYKSAGVDLDVYAESMSRIPALLHRTYSPRTLKLDGGFAGLFQLDFPGKLFSRNYRDPVLVSCTDGVGTKLKVAQLCDKHDTVGIDLVAMSVNDALCCGAEPLFFLDYVAMSHDDPDRLEQIVQGVSDGCVQADCSLLGGETAIMPDLYARGDYDLAGFCVGVVERDRVIDGKAIADGDVLIGAASSGFHSNGYSLLRKAVFEVGGFGPNDYVEELGKTVGDVLIEPTRIYAQPVRKILRHYAVKQPVHGIAHITGGGIAENFHRLLPPGVRAVFQRESWPVPPAFRWVQRLGQIDEDEMDRVFNMGIGLIFSVSPYYANTVQELLAGCEIDSWKIGKIVAGERGCEWTNETLFQANA